MLFQMRYNVLFRQFRLLTAQAGSIPAAIRLIFENCYRIMRYCPSKLKRAPQSPIPRHGARLLLFFYW